MSSKQITKVQRTYFIYETIRLIAKTQGQSIYYSVKQIQSHIKLKYDIKLYRVPHFNQLSHTCSRSYIIFISQMKYQLSKYKVGGVEHVLYSAIRTGIDKSSGNVTYTSK